MTRIQNVLYTGRTRTVGGRNGTAQSDDGRLDLKLSPPGAPGAGTNPEQLFAAGWSACFIGALGHVATGKDIKLPPDLAVNAEVDLGSGEGGFFLQARLTVSLPGIDQTTARSLVEGAHEICPYSKATRGNIDVELSIA